MGKDGTPSRSNTPPEVVILSITVTDLPPVRDPALPHRALRDQLARMVAGRRGGGGVAVALALLALVLVAVLAITPQRGQASRSGAPRHARLPDAERKAIAAALGYPYALRCLTITISDGSGDYARANVDRTNGCRQYHGYINASLHRIDGRWRLVLDEGQLFVPNRLLAPCASDRSGCAFRVGHGYPYRCLSPAIALIDPRFIRADFDRATCGRLRGG